MRREPNRHLAPYKITAVYFLLAALWIYFSDRLLVFFSESEATLITIQTYKGWLFVAVTSVVIFVLVERGFSQVWRSEEELRESEERYRSVFENTGTATVIVEEDTTISAANHEFEKLTGYSKKEIEGEMSWTDFVVAEDLEKMRDYHNKRREERGDVPTAYEFRFRDRGGNIIHIHVRVSMIPGTKRSVASLLDISDVKKAQQELLKEKERLAVTLRSIGEGVIAIDNHKRVVLLNRVAEELTCWTLEEAWGKPITEVLSLGEKEEKERYEERLDRVIRDKSGFESLGDVALVCKDGTRRLIEENISPIHSPESEVFGAVIVIRDVTERRRLEEEMIKSEKLESLAMVAGGIGHDFNNMLTAILGNLQLARELLPLEDKKEVAAAALERAENAGEKASGLAHQLLTFSKGGAPVKKAAAISDIVKDTSRFMLSGSNVAVKFDIPDELSLVDVDAGQISQVFGNILINAKHAMPDGGTIEVSMREAAEEELETLPLARGRYVRVSIRDEGEGIPAEQLPRIFDPFFTTKEKGSGLGLATSYSTVKMHGGHISVESELRAGATFHVYLPASKGDSIEDDKGIEVSREASGRILFMDDEESVRAVAERMLEVAGYEVEVAEDGAAVLKLYREAMASGARFDAVIMDLTIPGGMGGKEAISKLLEIDPGARVIVSSGYSTDPVMTDYEKYGFKGVVLKPFKPEELRRAVEKVLSQAG